MVRNDDDDMMACSPFKRLSGGVLEDLRNVSSRGFYNDKAKLFIEGQSARGIFSLCSGKAKLSACSEAGREIIMRFAGPGDILGLNAVVSDRSYGVTAEMTVGGTADFIPRASLLRLMKDNDELAFVVAEQLSESYYQLHDAIRCLGLATHPLERLVKLLLMWASIDDKGGPAVNSIRLPITHQEIADSIGSARVTVSRLFSELRRKDLLRSEGHEMIITNRRELEQMVKF